MRPATSRPAAADVGKYRSAEEHLVDGAAVDIADTADNLRDGVRVASAGATWMAIVYGLGGYRWRGTRFAPVLPTRSARLRFPLLIRGSRLQVDIEEHQVTYSVGFGKWWYLTSRCGRSEVVPGLTGTS